MATSKKTTGKATPVKTKKKAVVVQQEVKQLANVVAIGVVKCNRSRLIGRGVDEKTAIADLLKQEHPSGWEKSFGISLKFPDKTVKSIMFE